jgi:hypothetical protein
MTKLQLKNKIKKYTTNNKIRKILDEGIEFFDRDIDEYKKEYDMFSEITNNDMIPALLVIEGDGKKHKSFLYAPDRNYNELTEAVDIIKKHRKNVGLL